MDKRTHFRRNSDLLLHKSEQHYREIAEDLSQRTSEESIAFLDTILSTAPIGLGFVDRELRYVRVNQTLANINGRPIEDMIGHSFREIVPKMASTLEPIYDKVFETGEPIRGVEVSGETPLSPGQPRHWLVSYYPVRDRRGDIRWVGSVVQEITERKEAEDKLRAMMENLEKQVQSRTQELRIKDAELRQSQKMEAIGRLAGGVAHDFNNLLTGIIGMAEEIQESLPGGDPLRNELSQIIQASNRASNLTRQLLAFGRRQPVQTKLIDLNHAIKDMQGMIQRLLWEDIELTLHLDPDLGSVQADPTQIQQIVVNLVLNARDAMPSGGKLRIETSNVELDSEHPRNHIDIPPGPYILLTISDTGVGIPPELLEQIFEPFFTTKPPGSGSGLGLSTVYGVVKQNGGDVVVKSQPGKGAQFMIYLPKVAGRTEQRAAERVHLPRGNETILLAEDEDIVRRVASRALRRCGYTVFEAKNGTEALERSGHIPNPIHLLLTDIVMPGMSGRELVKHLIPQRPETAVLYMSGYAEELTKTSNQLGNAAFLEKSFTPQSLCKKVREVLDKRKYAGRS